MNKKRNNLLDLYVENISSKVKIILLAFFLFLGIYGISPILDGNSSEMLKYIGLNTFCIMAQFLDNFVNTHVLNRKIEAIQKQYV